MQNPRRFLHVGHRVTCDAWSRCRYARQNSPGTPSPLFNARQNSPSKPKNTTFGVFSARWANFFAFTHTPSQAGRKTSRTGRSDVATLKPTTPLQPLMQASMKPPSPMLAPKQQPLKPTTPLQPLIRANVKPPSPMLAPKQQPLKPPSPLQPKTTPKTPISHPQRRRRFQLAHLNGPQRRRRFQLAHLNGSQRR